MILEIPRRLWPALSYALDCGETSAEGELQELVEEVAELLERQSDEQLCTPDQ